VQGPASPLLDPLSVPESVLLFPLLPLLLPPELDVVASAPLLEVVASAPLLELDPELELLPEPELLPPAASGSITQTSLMHVSPSLQVPSALQASRSPPVAPFEPPPLLQALPSAIATVTGTTAAMPADDLFINVSPWRGSYDLRAPPVPPA
jgi:hypothetical protein